MSLINEALKKAQRLRHEEQPANTPASDTPPPARVAKRGRPPRATTFVLLGAGALALVVVSVVVTVVLLNRPAPETVVASTPAPVAAEPAPASPPPVVQAPVIPAPEPAPAPAEPVASAPAAGPITAVSEPTVAATPPPPPPREEPRPDERINAFVEAIRVAGIRSSGDDSRVLMNDRVYRVNDLVDRTLGLRLVKVEPSTLTFTDAQGVTYVKNF